MEILGTMAEGKKEEGMKEVERVGSARRMLINGHKVLNSWLTESSK